MFPLLVNFLSSACECWLPLADIWLLVLYHIISIKPQTQICDSFGFPHFFFPVCRSWLPFGRHLIICNAFSYQLFQCKRLLPSAISAMPPLLSSAAGFTSVFHLVVTFHSRRHETRPQVGLERTAATASSWQTNETVAVVTAGGTTHIHVHVPHPQPSSVGTSPPAAGFQVS